MASLTRMDALGNLSESADYTDAPGPVAVYLGRLAPGSRRAMAQVLRVIAGWLGGTAASTQWHELRYAHTQAIRLRLASSYSPASANKAIAALKGVLREAFRLQLMEAENYHRAVDIERVRGSRLPHGRALESHEVEVLFRACDPDTNQGCRDAAVLALCVGCGLRRSEVVGLRFEDLDQATLTITILGKGNKQRSIPVSTGCSALLNRWLLRRGARPGALLHAVNKADNIEPRQLSSDAVFAILKRLTRAVSISGASPHSCRRYFVSELLDRGVDIASVATLAGHANVATTAIYDRRGDQTRRRAVELLAIPAPEAAA